jgi:hypothetical protein
MKTHLFAVENDLHMVLGDIGSQVKDAALKQRHHLQKQCSTKPINNSTHCSHFRVEAVGAKALEIRVKCYFGPAAKTCVSIKRRKIAYDFLSVDGVTVGGECSAILLRYSCRKCRFLFASLHSTKIQKHSIFQQTPVIGPMNILEKILLSFAPKP